MNDEVTLSISQMDGAWRLMCAGSPGYVAEASEGVQYIFSGVPVGFFNLAVLKGSGLSAAALRTLGGEACAWAGTKNVPWLFVVTHERLAHGVEAVEALDGCGLAPVMPLTGMVAGSVGPDAAVAGLELTVPEDDSACGAVIDINSIAYAMDLEPCKPVIGTRTFWQDQFAVVGIADGKPASSAAVLMVDGHRYVALVATDPGQQRRGFADATMRRALQNAAGVHGERPTVLHATDAGRPIYERMGYATIATHTLFMEKRFLDQH
jgi:GNAT superfamily N-acetyltransferase